MSALFCSAADVHKFESELQTKALGRRIEYHPSTGSTNDLAAAAARAGAPHGYVTVADAQTSGRGRRGRTWEAPPALGLLFTVLIRPANLAPERLGWIPLAAGFACARALRAAGVPGATVKWPNDIVVAGDAAPGWRKLGGILCESVLPAGGAETGYVAVGIGLNVNQSDAELPPLAKAPPTSLRLESGHAHDRLAVLKTLLESLEWQLDGLASGDGVRREVSALLHAWWGGRMLAIKGPGGEDAEVIHGRFEGLDSFGRLEITDRAGQPHVLADAEILSILDA